MGIQQPNHLNAKRTSLSELLRAELDIGGKLSSDPINANLPDLVPRVTTLYSPWFGRICRECSDSFREGDLVRLCPLCGTAYHDDRQYDLHCWQKHFANERSCGSGSGKICVYTFEGNLPDAGDSLPAETALSHGKLLTPLIRLFLGGIESVWKPYGSLAGFRVERNSKWIGRKCPWCRNRVRVGDWIVECPCGPNCGTVFHQDIFRHLTCWNEWHGVSGNQYCPTTGAPYKTKNEATQE